MKRIELYKKKLQETLKEMCPEVTDYDLSIKHFDKETDEHYSRDTRVPSYNIHFFVACDMELSYSIQTTHPIAQQAVYRLHIIETRRLRNE